MAGQKVVSMDRAIDKKVKGEVGEAVGEAVQQIREELGLESDTEQNNNEDGFPQQFVSLPGKSKKSIQGAFNSFPSSEGYFGKIWKVLPSGDWEAKEYTITAPENVPDLEQEIVRLVHDKGWGSGRYVVQVRSHAEKGFKFLQHVQVGDYTPQEKRERKAQGLPVNNSHSPDDNIFNFDVADTGMRIADKILQTSKEMAGPQVDITKMAEINANTFRQGVEAAKAAAPAVTTSPVDQTSTLLQVITAIKEIVKPAEPPKQPDLIETVKVLKDLGIISAPTKTDEATFLGQLKTFKESLGLKYAHEIDVKGTDPMNMIEKVGTLATALRPLINPEAGPLSTGQLIIEGIMKFGEPLFGSLRDYLQMKKMEMDYRIASLSGGAPASLPTRTPVAPAQPSPQPQPQPGGGKVNILDELSKIVQARDESKFPYLRQTIFAFMGPQWIQGLITGDVTVDYIVGLSKMQFGNVFDNEPSKLFLHKFVAWLREEAKKASTATPSNGNGRVVAKCNTCGKEYDLSKEEWDEDNNCDSCHIPMVIIEQPAQTALPS